MAPRLGDLDAERHLGDPALKQRYVTTMFDLVAPRYDRFTRWFSYGMDRGWKAALLERALQALPPQGLLLDLACGTGDLALAAGASISGRAVGVDPSARMIALAEHRRRAAAARNVTYVRGDMMRLPLPDGTAHVVTVAYGLRNVPDHHAALNEIARVLAPGGLVACLDFYRPEPAWWRRLFLSYLSWAGNTYGWLWHREPAAYGYIARSIAGYVSAAAFSEDLAGAGLRVETVLRRLGGGIGLHVARKATG
jgi:demethylmenaquinone methyltransferase/2-methoxy-6-polyprenyl-1,4-benzoquinol methylase